MRPTLVAALAVAAAISIGKAEKGNSNSEPTDQEHIPSPGC